MRRVSRFTHGAWRCGLTVVTWILSPLLTCSTQPRQMMRRDEDFTCRIRPLKWMGLAQISTQVQGFKVIAMLTFQIGSLWISFIHILDLIFRTWRGESVKAGVRFFLCFWCQTGVDDFTGGNECNLTAWSFRHLQLWCAKSTQLALLFSATYDTIQHNSTIFMMRGVKHVSDWLCRQVFWYPACPSFVDRLHMLRSIEHNASLSILRSFPSLFHTPPYAAIFWHFWVLFLDADSRVFRERFECAVNGPIYCTVDLSFVQ